MISIEKIPELFPEDYKSILEVNKYIDDTESGFLYESMLETLPIRILEKEKRILFNYSHYKVPQGKTLFDIIIGGCGLQGLLLGLFLSKKYNLKCLILEKENLAYTTKTWEVNKEDLNILVDNDIFTYEEISNICEYENDEVEYNFDVDGENFSGFNLKKYLSKIDEKKFLLKTINKLKDADKGLLLTNEEFMSCTYCDEAIVIHTTKNKFFGKLFIDCTGEKSKIRYLFNKDNFYKKFYNVVGFKTNRKLKNKNLFVIKQNENFLLKIINDTIFLYQQSIKRKKFIPLFDKLIKNLKLIIKDTNYDVKKIYFGHIGFSDEKNLNNKSLTPADRIILLGDNICISDPFLGKSLNIILNDLPYLSSKINKIIKKNKITKKVLDKVKVNPKKQIQKDFLDIFQMLVNKKNIKYKKEFIIFLKEISTIIATDLSVAKTFSNILDNKIEIIHFNQIIKFVLENEKLRNFIDNSDIKYDLMELFHTSYKQLLKLEIKKLIKKPFKSHPIWILKCIFSLIHFRYSKLLKIN